MNSFSWDLRDWIEDIRREGLLREIKGADWDLEIGAITDINAKTNRFTLLFDEIKGYPKGKRLSSPAHSWTPVESRGR